MPYYESVLIARQEIGGSEAERLGERYEALLSEQGASVVRREYWGLRKLAYRLRKNRKGHYVMFHIDGPGAAIQELERQLRIDEDVIRYLSMRIESIPDEPSVIMRARLEREERREQENARRDAEKKAEAEAKEAAGGEAEETEEKAAASSGEEASSEGGGDEAEEKAAEGSGEEASSEGGDEAPAGGTDEDAGGEGDEGGEKP